MPQGKKRSIVNYVNNIQSINWYLFVPSTKYKITKFCQYNQVYTLVRGHAVAQLVETQRYKSEGRGFDS